MHKFILYAPNVHTGGGLALLKAALLGWDSDHELIAILDFRCKKEIKKLELSNVSIKYWVKGGLLSKIISEIKLYKISNNNETILCFHNIPPILSRSNNIYVFFQNRLIVEKNLSKLVNFRVFLITNLERTITRFRYSQKIKYLTQTSSIKELVKDWLEKIDPSTSGSYKHIVNVAPFTSLTRTHSFKVNNEIPKWDFLYISSGEPHKNHNNLIGAWKILANEEIFPSLAITVGENYTTTLKAIIDLTSTNPNVQITNLGQLNYDDSLRSYSMSRAFIFPSLCESYSQPLLEAIEFNLPILASECDFVRDICNPIQSFDPNSAISIARAVKRFMGVKDDPPRPISPSQFWNFLLSP